MSSADLPQTSVGLSARFGRRDQRVDWSVDPEELNDPQKVAAPRVKLAETDPVRTSITASLVFICPPKYLT